MQRCSPGPFCIDKETMSSQTRNRRLGLSVKTRIRRMSMNVFKFPIQRSSTRPSVCQQRGILHENADEEDFLYGSTTCCLSSYYSVFVARLAIMVMLAILIGMLTILTWHFTRAYTKSSLNSLAFGLRYELLQRPILRMWNILNSTVEITVAQVKLSEYVINHYEQPITADKTLQMHEAMRNVTWALFASKKALNAITISYRSGFVQAFHRDSRSNSTFYIYSEVINSTANPDKESISAPGRQDISRGSNSTAIWYREPINVTTGEKIGKCREIPPDDLINIAGLSDVRDGVASWHVAVSKFTDSPLLSAALPVRRPSDGSIAAAVGVTTSLHSVGQLMRELVEIHSGYMYLTSREGYVLATSTDTPLLKNSSTGPRLMQSYELGNRVIRSGAQWLKQAYGDEFPINHEVHAENVVLGKKKFYIDSFFLNLKRLPLVGVIIIPRSYIMGNVDHIGFTTLVIMISASICILVIGCVCIMILTSGVSKEMNLRAELISHLDARRKAEASSNYKSQFLANMSHELRTPMAAVIGLLDILIGDDCLTDEQIATITQIRKCSTALLRLLNNILDLSKVESGKLVLEEAEFDLGRELEGLVDMFSVQCNNQNVETILDLSDDIPKVVRGDSARVVQIFTNLISNSIKFTSTGHIILRAWCEHKATNHREISNTNTIHCPIEANVNDQGEKNERNNSKIILHFEVDDTGCGIDPSKWESVFESFEQADPSTTRKHGGTGLGLCIVRSLVHKMGGEIKVKRKEGSGTLMQLDLVLGMSSSSARELSVCEFNNLKVLLALTGNKARSITCQWLRKNNIVTWDASDWNGLTQVLQEIFPYGGTGSSISSEFVDIETGKLNKIWPPSTDLSGTSTFISFMVIIVDAALLDQNTNIWEEQLIYLEKYQERAKFAWILNHDTSNAVKVELRRKGHLLMVNKPLYKTKMIQILKTVAKENELHHGNISRNMAIPEDVDQCHEIDAIPFDVVSSDDSDTSEEEHHGLANRDAVSDTKKQHRVHCQQCIKSITNDGCSKSSPHIESSSLIGNAVSTEHIPCQTYPVDVNTHQQFGAGEILAPPEQCAFNRNVAYYDVHDKASRKSNMFCIEGQVLDKQDRCYLNQETDKGILEVLHPDAVKRRNQKEQGLKSIRPTEEQNSKETTSNNGKEDPCPPLEGLYILLAEDTKILQRVATKMLEKMGATVTVVGDGLQAVDTLKSVIYEIQHCSQLPPMEEGNTWKIRPAEHPYYDLILMDCQMPKLDGYEATKEIRRMEAEVGSHIPIVALTAHAMSSDEAKCLDVGMDAYLTKPIDGRLMVDTILTLTRSNVAGTRGARQGG